jgi:hypothetical protein
VKQSGVDPAANAKTVAHYNDLRENLAKLRRKLGWWRFWRVIMCITLVLIPVVIWKTNPAIRNLREEIDQVDDRADALFAEAQAQMQPLNRLFTARDSLNLVQTTIPMLSFEPYFSVEQEEDMRVNYDFTPDDGNEQSTLDVVAGHYNGNPFLFENKRIHTIGTETYHGYRTITWTETYYDSDGKLQRRTRSETLHATVVKPKPFYNNRVTLRYCSQGGPELSFHRDASHMERKSEKEIQRIVKKGEKKLKKLTDEAIRNDGDFMSMSNTEFEVLFDALNRDNEVQFRTLFTPLAQTNMVSLLRSNTGYGDDFTFLKQRRSNLIVSEHSQGRSMTLGVGEYVSHDFNVIKTNFNRKNNDFFKQVYFDFAPLWSIPAYQERPVHSLKPIPDYARIIARKEGEALANAINANYVVHPATKTPAILRADFVSKQDQADKFSITAFSYDIEDRVDIVPVHGGDGYWHDVAVHWDFYEPLERQTDFLISEQELPGCTRYATRSKLGIYSQD